MNASESPSDGGCACGHVRYRLHALPMIVHGCHCRWCQRETGSAFAWNALIESDRVELLQGEPECILNPSASGKGQRILRCPHCKVALWSHYANAGAAIRFIRVGTLDAPERFPPDAHIYTASKQPWVAIPEGAPAFAEFYDPKTTWSADCMARYRAAKAAHPD